MTNYDVFNGDTDGIFARHQLRLAIPLDTVTTIFLLLMIELKMVLYFIREKKRSLS